MPILDLFRRKPKPSQGAPNKAAPQRAVRRYQAAKPNRIAGFSLGTTTLMEEHRLDLMGLVHHSRMLAQNNDYYRAFLLMCRRHIIGPQGNTLQAMARRQDGELDKPDNDLLQAAFAKWGRRGNCEVSGRFSWRDMEKMAAMMVPRDGGLFIRFFRGREYGPFGFQIQFLTVDRWQLTTMRRCRTMAISPAVSSATVSIASLPGISRRWRPGSGYASVGPRIRVPASEIKYLAVPEDFSVHLSMPWGHTALRRINMLGGFEEAALTAARAGAAKMGFFTRTVNDDDNISSDEPQIEEMEPGMMETLPAGYGVEKFDTGYPDGESPLFVKLMLRGAAAGLGASYNGLANDLEHTNFSSLHVGKAEERDEWRILQGFFAEHLSDTVYREFIPMAILSGALPLPTRNWISFWKRHGSRAAGKRLIRSMKPMRMRQTCRPASPLRNASSPPRAAISLKSMPKSRRLKSLPPPTASRSNP